MELKIVIPFWIKTRSLSVLSHFTKPGGLQPHGHLRLLSNGSNAKSRTVDPLISAGWTPSGILPGLLVSKMAIFPPGPAMGTATLFPVTYGQ